MTLALLITAVGGAWALPATPNSIVINGTPQVGDKSISLTYHFDPNNVPGITSFAPTLKVKCAADNKWDEMTLSLHEVSSGTTIISLNTLGEFEAGKTYEVCFAYNNGNWVDEVFQSFVPAAPAPTGPEVTINDTKTEASFEMPQYDVTATYTIKRDMTVDMTATMGDGTDGVRYRVKKAQQGEGYEPADLNMMQVLALIAVNDGIEQKALTLDQDYFCRIYKLDEQTLQPEGDGVELIDFDFAPGLYALKAVAKADGDYAGETALSNIFVLFEGYQVTVPAGEFATFYKDEPLYADTETSADAELYTISSVNGDQAVLSDAIETAPSYTPLLVYNKGDQDKTFLLIPVDAEPNLALTVFSGFKGTLVARTTDDTSDNGPWNKAEGTTYYALNGLKFVYVNDAIAVGANRCWLEIGSQAQSARQLNLVFGEATGINGANGASGNSDWYDLSGRKLSGMPATKGVFIKDGKKIVIK